jgi:hypothetical protein
VGLRHAKKGSTIVEAWEIIGRARLMDAWLVYWTVAREVKVKGEEREEGETN